MKKYIFIVLIFIYLFAFNHQFAKAEQPYPKTLILSSISLPIVPQPSGRYLHVTPNPDEVTLFLQPLINETTIGILAHNYLAGSYFYEYEDGGVIQLEYEDGTIKNYLVSEVKKYKALDPNWHLLKDKETGKTFTNRQMFHEIYDVPDRLVLQTCIGNGEMALFIIAYEIHYTVHETVPVFKLGNNYVY